MNDQAKRLAQMKRQLQAMKNMGATDTIAYRKLCEIIKKESK